MIKKFFHGLAFGTGFGIAFFAVVVVCFQLFVVQKFGGESLFNNETITSPPEISQQKKFLGSPAIYAGDFLDDNNGVLAAGPGEIIGKATANSEHVEGLRLRLALNGSVMSQWAVTDAEGVYRISVPYGGYRIDGFDLDINSANQALPGKIDHPRNAHSSETFQVNKDTRGKGLHFRFIDPVEKIISRKEYSLDENVVINWQVYPGAAKYSVQVYEKDDPHAFRGNQSIFEWSERPTVEETTFDLRKQGAELKAGYYYLVEIHALAEHMGRISHTPPDYNGYDFEIVE